MTLAAESHIAAAPVRDQAAVRRWLYGVALLIALMVVVGGATRLTQSGLSITQWQPIHGVVPPLSAAEWEEEFARYRQIPEYQQLRQGMDLAGFKSIFWWEWSHRLLGRLIGFVVLLPALYFWATGRIGRALLPKIGLMLVLGGLQGAVGWWMVASGLVERTDVSQYRLATHLTLACVILAYVLWVARGLGSPALSAPRPISRAAKAILGLAFVQIFLGGLVAGLDAGMTYNTWPLMDGRFVPYGVFSASPFWTNFFENVTTVQFDHRIGAYLLLATGLFHAWQARGSGQARGAAILALLILVQAGLGISTLLLAVPLKLALLHQLGAVVVLGFATLHLRAMSQAKIRPEIA